MFSAPQLQPVAPQQPPAVRPIGQPQTGDVATTIVDAAVAQQQLVVNAKTKTALANMLSIRLQSGGATMGGPVTETLPEPPSAAGTLRYVVPTFFWFRI